MTVLEPPCPAMQLRSSSRQCSGSAAELHSHHNAPIVGPFNVFETGWREGQLFLDLVGPHLEARKQPWPENVGQRHIRRVAAGGDQDTADAWRVVARIESVPAAAEINLHP